MTFSFFNKNFGNDKLYALNFISKCTSLLWLCGIVGVLGYKLRCSKGASTCRSAFASAMELAWDLVHYLVYCKENLPKIKLNRPRLEDDEERDMEDQCQLNDEPIVEDD